MSDSERFLGGGGLADKLFRAGIDEAPSPRVVQRTLVALGAGAATLGAAGIGAAAGLGAATGAEGAATVLGTAGLVKFLAIGVVSGVAVSSASWSVTTALEQSRDVERAPVVQPVNPRVERAAPATPAVGVPIPLAPEPLASVAEPVAPRAPAGPEDASPLAAEVALVDRAHAALRRGDAGGALAALESYERTFAAPRLLPEVLALRMDASDRLGDLSAARLWAGRLLSQFPKSAQAARARALIER